MVEMTPRLAEICGIHAGDGYLRHRISKIELEFGGHPEERDYYDKHVIPMINKIFNLNIKGKTYVKGTYGFVTTNKQFCIFNELGFPYGKKSTIVQVPKKILESKNKILCRRFLRGLFDTDGCLHFINRKSTKNYGEFKRRHNYYPRILIVTVSKLLAKEVSFMLEILGIKNSVFGHQPKNNRDSYRYTIAISGVQGLNKWMNLIGIKNPVKLTRYFIWKKFGFCPPHTTLQQREDILNDKLDIYSVMIGS